MCTGRYMEGNDGGEWALHELKQFQFQLTAATADA